MKPEALQILKRYHQELVERLVHDVAENQDNFGAFSFSPADEMLERYSHKLNGLLSVLKNVEHQSGVRRVRHRYRVVSIEDAGEGLDAAINAWLDENASVAIQSLTIEPGDGPRRCLVLYVQRIETIEAPPSA